MFMNLSDILKMEYWDNHYMWKAHPIQRLAAAMHHFGHVFDVILSIPYALLALAEAGAK